MNIYKFENKTRKFIEENRKSWYIILFIIGITFGMLFQFLSGNNNGLKLGISVGLLFMIVEFFAGGSGIE